MAMKWIDENQFLIYSFLVLQKSPKGYLKYLYLFIYLKDYSNT